MPPRLPGVRVATLLLLAVQLAACATGAGARHAAAEAATTFVVVRHAEKAVDGSDDPPLSAAGEARAERLAASLADSPLVAVYATAYRRTRATAAPSARLHGLPVTPYDAGQPATAFASALRGAHAGGTVLVVAHSNTAPAIAAALCGCEVAPMGESDYGRHLVVQIGEDGDVTLLDAPLATP